MTFLIFIFLSLEGEVTLLEDPEKKLKTDGRVTSIEKTIFTTIHANNREHFKQEYFLLSRKNHSQNSHSLVLLFLGLAILTRFCTTAGPLETTRDCQTAKLYHNQGMKKR